MRHRGQKGYTLLEVLLFIAVSSLMFIVTLSNINGRQKQVQFSQSTREFDSKIRDIINDVTTGYYPTNSTVSCKIVSNEVQIQKSTNQSVGTSDDCVYIGKVIQFSPDGDSSLMRIYTLAGRRYSSGNSPVVSIAEAKPKAVSLLSDVTFEETSEDYTTLYGLKITKVIRPVSSSIVTPYGSVGIISDFGGSNVSESQSVQIGGIVGSVLGESETTALTIINQLTDEISGPFLSNGYIEKNTDEGLVICLQSPEGKNASISFGARGVSTTDLQIDGYNRGCGD